MNALRKKLLTIFFPDALQCRLHRPQILGVQPGTMRVPFAGEDAKVTNVLHRCPHCGQVGSFQLHGQWTLDQVRGIPDPPAGAVVDAFLGQQKP